MFNKLLIANRGEIACRIIKTAQLMGIKTVAVYSSIDADALHVQLADEAICIGQAEAKDSYLQGQRIIQAALKTGAQAIHPGYGFLSENAGFARLCEDNNIVFVGPPVKAIEAMGSKSAAKQIMQQADVPLVPGYHGEEQSESVLKYHADNMGYPVLLKAAAGGGGKGMRQVWSESEFSEALAAAKREAINSFADDKMLVEKYLTQPRHVEVQVFCDNQGNGVYLFERDCSVQRRHQKVIEEAPAPGMTATLREQMGQAALKAAKAIDYRGAGTVEFLLDQDDQFYFMEMNTRLQVEHPVTEMITAQDLVEWQLRVANGELLPLQQHQLKINGHAFEARIYAEDPNNNFLPATGVLSLLKTPTESSQVRVDTGVRQGDAISIYYDPMIAKLVVWGDTRDQALGLLRQALSDYHIDGVSTNIGFLHKVASHSAFAEAQLTTNFIDKHSVALFTQSKSDLTPYLAHCALAVTLKISDASTDEQDQDSPWSSLSNWRLNHDYQKQLTLKCQGQLYTVSVRQSNNNQTYWIAVDDIEYDCQGQIANAELIAQVNGHKCRYPLSVNADDYTLFADGKMIRFEHATADLGLGEQNQSDASLHAPMNGRVVALLAESGLPVKKDQTILVMEAMKMEHSIKAPSDGVIEQHYYQVGDLVDGGQPLLAFSETKAQ